MGKISVMELKKALKSRRLPINGSKAQLLERMAQFEQREDAASRIQRCFWKHMFRKHVKLRGPALFDRQLCINKTDPLSAVNLINIPQFRFFSFVNADNQVYGYDIRSLTLLLSDPGPLCPYTRLEISRTVLTHANFIRRTEGMFFSESSNQRARSSSRQRSGRSPELKCRALFSDLGSLGLTVSYNWFWDLCPSEIVRFIQELSEIWYVRAPLNSGSRLRIFPSHRQAFTRAQNRIRSRGLSHTFLRETGLSLLRGMINSAVARSDRILGSHYALGALTLVSHSAAVGLPWLYSTFSEPVARVKITFNERVGWLRFSSSRSFSSVLSLVADVFEIESDQFILVDEDGIELSHVDELIQAAQARVEQL